MSTKFNEGDVVEWESAANGTWKKKRGVITRVTLAFPFFGARAKTQCVTVSVPPASLQNGLPSTAKPRIYQPRLSALKLILAAVPVSEPTS
jgi:hypothetical protein